VMWDLLAGTWTVDIGGDCGIRWWREQDIGYVLWL
jgi:hypothetical protein